jgi:hypothetical protein
VHCPRTCGTWQTVPVPWQDPLPRYQSDQANNLAPMERDRFQNTGLTPASDAVRCRRSIVFILGSLILLVSCLSFAPSRVAPCQVWLTCGPDMLSLRTRGHTKSVLSAMMLPTPDPSRKGAMSRCRSRSSFLPTSPSLLRASHCMLPACTCNLRGTQPLSVLAIMAVRIRRLAYRHRVQAKVRHAVLRK